MSEEERAADELTALTEEMGLYEQPNRTWWIVLTPTPMRELNGVLVTEEGDRVHVLMGPLEDVLVRELARYADPTVDVSVAHGWEQVPPELAELYKVKRAVR